jgi:hypothetical protein
VITPDDIPGVDENTARRILVVARLIAPCLDTLGGESKSDAIAILTGVAEDVAEKGSRFIASQRIGPASVSYRAVESSFSDEYRAGLRSLCGVSVTGGPIGQFPQTRPFRKIWPDDPACE